MWLQRIASIVFCLIALSRAETVFAQAVSVGGELHLVVEELENGSESERIALQVSSSEVYYLFFNGLNPDNVKTGDYVFVEGEYITDPAYQDSILVRALYHGLRLNNSDPSYSAFGPKKLMVMRGKFTDSPERCTRDEIIQTIWGSENSVEDYFEVVSHGNLSFPADADGNNEYDIFDVDFGIPTPSNCNTISLSILAEQLLVGQGVDWSFYDHRMLILPKGMPCNFRGSATINCTDIRCDTWMNTSCERHSVPVFLHELGHNIGLEHAGLDLDNDLQVEDPYGDQSCVMGSTSAMVHFNAPHKAKLDWIDQDHQKQITQNGIYTVTAVEATDIGIEPQMLIIRDSDNPYSQSTFLNYCLSYRSLLGKYSWLSYNPDRNSIHVNRCVNNGKWLGGTSYLGTSYFIGDTPIKWDSGYGISVKIVEANETSAKVEVRFDDFDEPTPTVTPVASSSSSPEASSSPAPSDSIRPSESLEPDPTLDEGQPEVSSVPVPVPSTSIPYNARIVLNSFERAGRLVVKGKLLINGKSATTEEIAIYQITNGLGNLTALATTSPSEVIHTDRKGRFRYVFKRSKTKLRFRFLDTWSKSVRFKQAKK